MHRLLPFLCLFLFLLTARAQTPQLLFHATLSGQESVPAVSTNGKGLITLLFNSDRSKAMVSGLLVNLEGGVTGAYLQFGKKGETGDTLLNLLPLILGRRVAGELDIPQGLLSKLLSGNIYANILTSAHPDGEIRAQMAGETDLEFGGMLTGTEVTPPSNSGGIAFGGIHFPTGSDEIVYAFLVRGLSGPITSAAIYEGQPGQIGALVTALPNVFGNMLSGLIELDELAPDFLEKCRNGEYYALIKTAAFPDGEVRGQLRFLGHLASFAPVNGLQQLPDPVSTGGFGLSHTVPNAALDSFTTTVLVDGLMPASATLQIGAPGTIGALFQELESQPIAGLYRKTYPVDEARMTDFIEGRLYLNVTTQDYPAGEIRGQLKNCLRKGYAFDLCGSQVVPPNNSTALGMAMLSVDQVNCYINYIFIADGLAGAPGISQVNAGIAGENGPALYNFVTAEPLTQGEHSIMAAQGLMFEHDSLYLSIPSASFPDGEIRGQIRRELSCPLVSGVESLGPVRAVEVYPNPFREELQVVFEARSAISGQLVLHDVYGKKVFAQHVECSAGGQQIQLHAGSLPLGVYRLTLNSSSDLRPYYLATIVKSE